jgi:hypothetical protein
LAWSSLISAIVGSAVLRCRRWACLVIVY